MLFSADVHDVYDSIRVPAWISHGQRGDFVDYRQLPIFAERGRWHVTVFDTGALPYFERGTQFAEEWGRFQSMR